MDGRALALYLVERERQRQEDKWGPQRHGMPVWVTVLTEEVGEASQALLQLRSMPLEEPGERRAQLVSLQREVVQVAAVAVAWLEHINEAITAGQGLPSEVWE